MQSNNSMSNNCNSKVQIDPFAKDVLEGLSQMPKRLSSKYFYDDEGSRIFQEIMEMPEYYLTNAEFEILQQQAGSLHQALSFGESYSIIELGAGDGSKTKELLSFLLSLNVDPKYYPIDISAEAVNILKEGLLSEMPQLDIAPLVGDYFKILNQLELDKRPALFLFLGSNIGNYEKNEAIQLLKMFGQYMRSGDKLLVGFDLKKNPWRILHAYNDEQGITRRFNLNLLKRMNRELGANFNLEQFEFYPTYDPKKGDVRSYIVSNTKQEVCFEGLEQSFAFEKDELIYTELSKKYSLPEIDHLAMQSGFVRQEHFLDANKDFTDSLWIKQ